MVASNSSNSSNSSSGSGKSMEEDEEDIFIGGGEGSEKSFHLLKVDNELFNDADNVPQKVVNVKRVNLPRGGEDWEILENNKVSLVLKGTRFTNSEKKFLRTVEGMKFLISEYKSGTKSVVKIKEKLKKIV